MLAETIAYRNVYIICGYTDMRKSINGLVAILTQQYQIRPDAESLYLFCGKRADRMKAILWEEDGLSIFTGLSIITTGSITIDAVRYLLAIHFKMFG